MTRHNFPASVKKTALARAQGRCEATGPRYGLPLGERCNADLSVTGVEHDHFPLGAHHPDSATLENDVVCCPAHNQWAANHFDKAVEAKIKRVRRRAGLEPDRRKPRRKIKSQGFQKGPKQKIPSRPFQKRTT